MPGDPKNGSHRAAGPVRSARGGAAALVGLVILAILAFFWLSAEDRAMPGDAAIDKSTAEVGAALDQIDETTENAGTGE
ncbi:hypothetical protein GCM10011371_29200 [Novosphingobium marinum]|uniref:Uncharacterized protein n=1 Tax=Novosphingobium marinum TaxID=1514948 RepID=A0A7Y9Y0P3_9SPHN|nr:hypothetical protein [Novosphingobium marinum]NYH96818.1 hypothetical protein [Novosphingobium marinum]GGC40013.1 hypothetical protein GCM10011371_29200 [Novosphingobium marinum]